MPASGVILFKAPENLLRPQVMYFAAYLMSRIDAAIRVNAIKQYTIESSNFIKAPVSNLSDPIAKGVVNQI